MNTKKLLGYILMSIPFIAIGVVLPIYLFGFSGYLYAMGPPVVAALLVLGCFYLGSELIG